MVNYKIINAMKRRDRRGFLIDFLKQEELPPSDRNLGQIYFITFEKKGSVRGNHYHTKKKEWFVAVKGKLKVFLEDLRTKEKISFVLDGDSDKYERVYVPQNVAHAFKNITKVAMMINYCNKPYHVDDPDTIKRKLV